MKQKRWNEKSERGKGEKATEERGTDWVNSMGHWGSSPIKALWGPNRTYIRNVPSNEMELK